MLAPVDFDMSFRKQDFFDFLQDTVESSESTRESFESTIALEQKEMELALAGSSSSTGLIGVEGGRDLEEKYQLLRYLLRDTLISGYRHALNSDEYIGEKNKNTEADYALIKMALILSSHKHS
jgi:hypothetical protein